MNRYFNFIVIFLVVVLCPNLYADDSFDAAKAIYPFFNALKKGDVRSIKKYIDDDLYQKKRVLFEENKKYPEFLRTFYKDAEFQIIRSRQLAERDASVDVRIVFPDSRSEQVNIKMKKEEKFSSGMQGNIPWKIVSTGNEVDERRHDYSPLKRPE